MNLITRMITENDRTIFLDTISRFTIDEMNFSTVIPDVISSDGSYTRQTYPFSFTTDLDLTTVLDDTKTMIEEQWFNVNQSHRRGPSGSFLYWKRTDGNPNF